MTKDTTKGPSRGGRPPEAEVSEFSGKTAPHSRSGTPARRSVPAQYADAILGGPASRATPRCVGIELVLKSFLAAEHWALVFENPATASADDFRKGDFKSVGFVECLKRLQSITPMHVTETHRRELNRMRTKRNQLSTLEWWTTCSQFVPQSEAPCTRSCPSLSRRPPRGYSKALTRSCIKRPRSSFPCSTTSSQRDGMRSEQASRRMTR
jgi:hypothetical protein